MVKPSLFMKAKDYIAGRYGDDIGNSVLPPHQPFGNTGIAIIYCIILTLLMSPSTTLGTSRAPSLFPEVEPSLIS